jgi:hypothetical protein
MVRAGLVLPAFVRALDPVHRPLRFSLLSKRRPGTKKSKYRLRQRAQPDLFRAPRASEPRLRSAAILAADINGLWCPDARERGDTRPRPQSAPTNDLPLLAMNGRHLLATTGDGIKQYWLKALSEPMTGLPTNLISATRTPGTAQPPRPPRPSRSICCHHSDEPNDAAWALKLRVTVAIHVAIRHKATFLMIYLFCLAVTVAIYPVARVAHSGAHPIFPDGNYSG